MVRLSVRGVVSVLGWVAWPLGFAALLACGDDPVGNVSTGDADAGDETPSGPLPPVAAEVDLEALLDPSTITYEIDDARTGAVPGTFDEPVWQIGITFYSQTALGSSWSHMASLILPNTLPAGVSDVAILQRATPNTVAGISDSLNFIPQFGGMTADRLDIPLLLLDGLPPPLDLRDDPSLSAYAADHPDCFEGPIADDALLTDCLWAISEESGRADVFPALPVATAIIRAGTLMEVLAEDVPTFALDFDAPTFEVDRIAVLAHGLAGISLRYAMAMDHRVKGVMAASADIGAFEAFFALQGNAWSGDYSFGDPVAQEVYWSGAESASFRDLFEWGSLSEALASRSYLMAVGTHDPRYPLRALEVYRGSLPPDTSIVYVGDYAEGFGATDHLLAWRAFLAHLFHDRELGTVSVSALDDGGNVTFEAQVEGSTIITTVELWYTERHDAIDDGDFRDAIWTHEPMIEQGGGRYALPAVPLAENVAFFARVQDAQNIYEGVFTSEIELLER